jgi:hypothetical protein
VYGMDVAIGKFKAYIDEVLINYFLTNKILSITSCGKFCNEIYYDLFGFGI